MPDPVMTTTDAELAELRARLRATRWPARWPGTGSDTSAGWAIGADVDTVRRLAETWATTYDWRRQEAAVNALPWHTVDIDGTPIRYLRFDAETDGGLPVLATNGWPSSFLELVPLARRLAEPSRHGGTVHGGEVRDANTVIIPVLPGFPGSPQRPSLPADLPTHEIWHRLLHDTLGFTRYAAHGGDLGAGTTSLLAEAYPGEVAGIHLLAVADPVDVDPATITPAEQAYLDEVARWVADEGAYEHQQHTRPMTLAYGLSDSPVGLLAWIVEKYRAWSDGGGDLSRSFDDDFLLTQASLYWFTNSIGTSFRPYWEYRRDGVPPLRRIDVPTAVAQFPADLVHPPRSWIERTYHLTRHTEMPRGGHFAAHEETALLADDIAEFLRTLR